MIENIGLEIKNFDIEIKKDGRWYHEGGEIKRLGLVKLFASVLSCDDEGRYWLTTPVEKGEIQVEDAPFVIQKMRLEGQGRQRCVILTDNLDRDFTISSSYPLDMRAQQQEGMRPYLRLESGLSALIKHSVFYELAELALGSEETDGGAFGFWSDGVWHVLEDIAEAEAQDRLS